MYMVAVDGDRRIIVDITQTDRAPKIDNVCDS
jgi:hypothetical protein